MGVVRSAARKISKGAPHKLKNFGEREVHIRFPGGKVIVIVVPYYARAGKHKKRGRGFYPALLILGIFERCSPSLIAEIAMLAAAMSSFDETKAILDLFRNSCFS